MNRRPQPNRDRIMERLIYDPVTGEFTHAKNHVKARKGRIAGLIRNDGYKSVCVDGQSFLGHHIAWLIIHNEWVNEIDHKDGNRSNNAISNLRKATRQQNNGNSNGWGLKKKSGLPRGVYRHPGDPNRYRAQIFINYKPKHLGCFNSVKEAESAYLKAARAHFGKFVKG